MACSVHKVALMLLDGLPETFQGQQKGCRVELNTEQNKAKRSELFMKT